MAFDLPVSFIGNEPLSSFRDTSPVPIPLDHEPDVGRGFTEPEAYFFGFHPADPRSELQKAVRTLNRAKVRGKNQRRGDYSHECIDVYKQLMVDFGDHLAFTDQTKRDLQCLIGRKNVRKLMTWKNAYDVNYSKHNTIIGAVVSALADGRMADAEYQLSNIRGVTDVIDRLRTHPLAWVLNQKNGADAEDALEDIHRIRMSYAIRIPARHRKNFVNAIQLLCLDWLHTKCAIDALNFIHWTEEE